jgi:hypothetical protein
MKIKIKETGKIKHLNIYDPKTGIDWTNDLIGNAGALQDGQFEYDYDTDVYLTNQDTFNWWNEYIINENKTESDIVLLAEELRINESIIRERIAENTGNDYEDHRKQAIFVMDQIRKDY